MENTLILLVEDHPDDEFLALRTLEKHQIRNVVVKHSGIEALDYLFSRGNDAVQQRTEIPKLIILDLRLPCIDGFEFLEAIRADEQTCDIPVVALSSSHYERDIKRCRELGVIAYLTKPLDMDEFLKATKKIIW
ncbi:MAG: response regulator [Geobacteraceae bacterium]|nr:MAG: response regulator [Geobacteraceae bacterium]